MVSMVNWLSTEHRGRIVGCLCEGMSIRGTVRVTGAAKNTITKLLCDLGAECAHYQGVALRNLACTRIEGDEIWSCSPRPPAATRPRLPWLRRW